MHGKFEVYDPCTSTGPPPTRLASWTPWQSQERPTKEHARRAPSCIGCGRLIRPGEVFSFGDDGRAHHDVCPRRLELQLVAGSVLSDNGRALLAFVRSLPESATCEHCAAAYLDTDRHGALKAIRELILGGHVLCTQASCGICHEDRIVVRLRPAPFELPDPSAL